MTALLLNGSDWLLKTVTGRMLRDNKLVCDVSLFIEPCSREYKFGRVPYK